MTDLTEHDDRPHILLVHPGLGPPGGGEGLAAWLIQGLVDSSKYRIAIACLRTPDFEGLNRYFGTGLKSTEIECLLAPAWYRSILRILPTSGALLEMSLLERFIGELHQSGAFDFYISTCNEWSFPVPGLQYIHYPKYHPTRGEGDYRWFHYIPGVLPTYRWICRWLGDVDMGAVRRNVTVANSAFTAKAYEDVHGLPVTIVHPPVPGNPAEPLLWENRENRFVCLGRIAREKNIPRVIELIHRVREDLPSKENSPTLHLLGSWNCDRPLRQEIEALQRRYSDWISIHPDLPREELETFIAASRYGIHGMLDEHFGMAIAELQRAGCVAFVPATGGAREVVGEEACQIYSSLDDAVEKICSVLADREIQGILHRRALKRRDLYSSQRFIESMLKHVESAIAVGQAS